MMIKHYVEFDTLGAKPEIRVVRSRIPSRLRKIPKHAYAIEYFDREEIRKNGELWIGRTRKYPKRIMFGVVYTAEELIKEGYDKFSPLYRNAENCGGKVIKCVTGNWQLWDKDWIITGKYEDLQRMTDAV